MKRIFLAVVSICLTVSLMGQNIKLEKPTAKKASSFAIVIDNGTFNAVSAQVYAYRDAVQNDGLATYILRGDWENPMQIRNELIKLYKKAKNLDAALFGAKNVHGGSQALADYYRDHVLAAMQELRITVDQLETMTPDDSWPFPSYGEMLFSVK